MPAHIRELLRPQHGLAGKTQRVSGRAGGLKVAGRTTIVEPHRPPWVDVECLPRLVPYRVPEFAKGFDPAHLHQYVEPISLIGAKPLIDEALRFIYPWRTIGWVLCGLDTNFDSPVTSGTGVLVGRNLMLTASHIAPWGRGPGQWWMRFIPGYRAGEAPHGSSYVEHFYGTVKELSNVEPAGVDYVICKLYTPLGEALGWMGSRSFGDEDDYKVRRYISVGYPQGFGNKPAVEFDIDIDDIDGDGDGLELETTWGKSPFYGGWSGGPLWLWENEKPYVVGVLSGEEWDEYDPPRYVFAGGGLMVDRVKYGMANFA